MINYIPHSKIDKARWDKCIEQSPHRLIYAFSWYLDIVSPNWEALADADYQTVMPLPVKRKWGLPYLVQPVFTQQLGVFSVHELSARDVAEYLNRIPGKFLRQVFNLNTANVLPPSPHLTDRVNFELDLHEDYGQLARGYHENTRRNAKKAGNYGLFIESSDNIASFMDCYKKYAKESQDRFGLHKLERLLQFSIAHKKGEIVFARDRSGTVVSGAFFLKDNGRIVYMASFTTTAGQEISAMFLIVDEIIRRYAGSSVTLDFEGSMIPGVARFFAGFGAAKKVYQQYRKGL